MNALFKLLLIGLTFALAAPAAAQVRIKDIVTVEGVRSNQLVGYGLVVGLNGTGDSLRNAPFTERAIEGMLERLGIGNLTEDQMRTANTAAVMVTASLPPFARAGSTIDVVVFRGTGAERLHRRRRADRRADRQWRHRRA